MVLPVAVAAQSTQPRAIGLAVGLLETVDSAAAVRRGFELETFEASRTAQLFRGSLRRYRGASVDALARSGCSVLVGGVAATDRAAELQAEASRRGLLYLNAAAGADSLRSERCGDLALHVAPSNSMRESAAGGSSASPVAWDPQLVRFGAEQLNDRFRHRYAADMTEDAWCGWMAAKIAWEGALRARSPAPGEIRDALLHPDAGFDGHKGRALSFDPSDRQLYHPLYASDDLRELAVVRPSPAHGRGECRR